MKAAILYNKFLDHDGRYLIVGGVETYLLNLARVCNEMGMDTAIYQWANTFFVRTVSGLLVKGVAVCHMPFKKRNQLLFDHAYNELDINKDILIFGADHVSVPSRNLRHISIQHGVSWDLPVKYTTSRKIVKYQWAAKLKKRRMNNSAKKYFENCLNTVCVDYNFINWYRTTAPHEIVGRIWIIPNFSEIVSDEIIKKRRHSNEKIRILFARRFVQMRGTRLMVEAAKSLLGEFPRIHFTFAGEGPDEKWMREQFSADARVNFIKYSPDETLRIHLEHDIAVIPSIASEGTSLSVAEAMATGCPVVATSVGGITNMIIDQYNGFLVMPNAKTLRDGIKKLIVSPELRHRMGDRAYKTAKNAFSLSQWKQSWKNVLAELADDE